MAAVIEAEAARPGAVIGMGRVVRVNVSNGGVPKRPVASARIGRLGLDGDSHNERGGHGGPMRAVCLLAIEAIRRVAAEGHPLEPGGAGENLTTEGIELALLPVGTAIEVGDAVRLELTGTASPCRTIRFNFREGRFGRLSPLAYPADSRVYARVVRGGEVQPGDEIRVFAAQPDAGAIRERRLHALDDAEASSVAEFWRAIAEAGFDMRVSVDGDYLAGTSPDLPGPPFNMAHGLDWVPVLQPDAIEHFRRAGTVGWLAVRERPWDEAQPDLDIEHFGAVVGDMPEMPSPHGVDIRRAAPPDADAWSILLRDATAADVPAREQAAWHAASAARLRSRDTDVFLAEADGRVVGGALLHVRHGAGWLRGATVLPAYRGRGIHRALLAARIRAAVERGCDVVGASAAPRTPSARNLRAAGFDSLGVRGLYRVDGNRRA